MKKIFLFFFISLMFSDCFAQKQVETETLYTDLKKANEEPEKVTRLKLTRKKLREVPPEIFLFTNLRELDLSHNKLDLIPEEIGKLENLQSLNLSSNKLTALPSSIGQLKKLETLSAARNDIQTLPPEIGELQNLRYLNLWDCDLQTIPDELGQLTELKELELRSILFTDEERARIKKLLPNTKIYLSPSCQCQN